MLRRAVTRHIVLSLLAAAVIAVLVISGAMWFARQSAHDNAERVAKQVTQSVLGAWSRHDFSQPHGEFRDELGREVAPFITGGMVYRVKVWTTSGDSARIVYSDEPVLEGAVMPLSPKEGTPSYTGEVDVQPVPRDFEHRFEAAAAGDLLEAFVEFPDAGGHRTLLELYVPADIGGTVSRTARALVPLVTGGFLILALATLPLSISLARRIERGRAEQRAARLYGLTSAEATRTAVARSIHDDIVPSLASAKILLETMARHDSTALGEVPAEKVDRAHRLIGDAVIELREILYGLAPASSSGAVDVADVVARVRGSHTGTLPQVALDTALDVSLNRQARTLLTGVAEELLRNAFKHARADLIEIRLVSSEAEGAVLVVTDNGVGITTSDVEERSSGVGLRLARALIEDFGGTMTIAPAPVSGTTVTASLPLDVAREHPPGERRVARRTVH